MNDKDYEDTKPIMLDDDAERVTRTSRTPIIEEEEFSRTEKYKEVIEEDEKSLLAREKEEKFEEELAEKNIYEAEQILAEEKAALEAKPKFDEFEDDEDFSILVKFKKLSKKSKIILISLAVLVVVLLVVLISVLVLKFGNGSATNDVPVEEGSTNESEHIEVEEIPPVIVDNYYYKDGSLYLLDSNLKEIGTYECTNKDENLCFVAFNNSSDVLNSSVLVREDGSAVKERLPIIDKEFAFINDSSSESVSEINLYSISTGQVKGTYRDVKTYDNGYVVVKGTDNKYGLLQVNSEMKVLLSNQYEYLGMLNGSEYLVVKSGKGYHLINKVGKTVSKTISGTVKYYSNDLIVTNIGKEYSVYDFEGNMLQGSYDFATVNRNYMALVKDDKVYVKDKDGNKYNEEGISLNNDVYVKTYTYDEEDNLISSKLSFALNVTDTKMELVVYDQNLKDGVYTQFNMKSPEINSAYKYINYFDDKLYFYSDEAKETLIGSYTCTNKNLIGSETTLDNCYPARDTIYESGVSRNSTIPIINQRYVFVQDGSSVNLYDLKNRKQLVSYNSVNSYTDNNDFVLGHYDGSLDVVALNKKGQYGMITITADSASTTYKFQYNKMEKVKDYIIAQDTDDKWIMLFDKNSTTGKFPGRVVDYTSDKLHFMIDVNGLYYVYSTNGDLNSSVGFKKLILSSKYFVGVDGDSKLNIYDYSGDLITKESLTISSSSCTLSDNFKVEYKNNQYNVSVCDGSEYKVHVYDVSEGKYLSSDDNDDSQDSTDDSKEEDTPKEENDGEQESSSSETE